LETLLPQLATPLLVLVPAAVAWDLWGALRVGRLDYGLLDSFPASLYEWLGIALAYGGALMIIDYAGLIAMHMGILLLVASHLQHFTWLLGLSPPGLVRGWLARPAGVMIVGGFITHAACTARRGVAGFRSSMIPGVLLVAASMAGLLGLGLLHAYLGLAAVYAALAVRPGRHFILHAWVRPIRALAAKLYEER